MLCGSVERGNESVFPKKKIGYVIVKFTLVGEEFAPKVVEDKVLRPFVE